MKVLTVVGARPQFIKAAVVSHKLRKNHTEILVHTGQHFDKNMSETFFEELNIPQPNYNLGISGGTHSEMTGRMMIAIEKVLQEEQPDWLLLYGDTNSTLAGALAAAKLHIKICHVESGARTHSMTNPEEINRICTDHVSTLLLTSTESGMYELRNEGLESRGQMVGDPMYDAFIEYSAKKPVTDIRLIGFDGTSYTIPEEYYYLTCHREENTNRGEALAEILRAMDSLDSKTIYPVHPRNRQRAMKLMAEGGFKNIVFCEPIGYLESIALTKNAKGIVTDSGGLQREAFFAKKKCVTVLDFVTWPETMTGRRNELAKPKADEILLRLNTDQEINEDDQPFGDGDSASKIIKAMESYLE